MPAGHLTRLTPYPAPPSLPISSVLRILPGSAQLPSPGLSSVLGGVDLLDSKLNGSVAPLGPWPWRFLQTTSLAPYPPCHCCHHFFLPPSHKGVAVFPTSSPPAGDHLFYEEGTGFHVYCWLCYLYQVTCRWDLLFSGERPSLFVPVLPLRKSR